MKSLVVPLTLTSAGLLLSDEQVKRDLRRFVQDDIGFLNTTVDDYLQHLPVLVIAAYDLSYNRPIGTVGHQAKYMMISTGLSLGLTYLLKEVTGVSRPQGGPRSFPSGHTTYAFTVATVQYQILKERGFLWSSTGYIPAIATGILRVLRDKHWVPDVLVGAGIGILVPNLLARTGLGRSTVRRDGPGYQIGILPTGLTVMVTF